MGPWDFKEIAILFRKGKSIRFKAMIQSSTFLNISKTLEDSWEIIAKDFAILLHFFMQNYINQKRSQDLKSLTS